MSSSLIEGFLIDDENEQKFAAHGVSARQVLQVLGNPHIIARNRRRRKASHMVIGQDDGGRCIAIPVEATPGPGLWRPITAWPCKEIERNALERR